MVLEAGQNSNPRDNLQVTEYSYCVLWSFNPLLRWIDITDATRRFEKYEIDWVDNTSTINKTICRAKDECNIGQGLNFEKHLICLFSIG